MLFVDLLRLECKVKRNLGKPVVILLQSSRSEMIMTWAKMVARNDSAEEKAGGVGEGKQICQIK